MTCQQIDPTVMKLRSAAVVADTATAVVNAERQTQIMIHLFLRRQSSVWEQRGVKTRDKDVTGRQMLCVGDETV